jgi:cytochrome c5
MRLFALFVVLLPAIAVAADLSKSQRAEIEARIQPFSHACVAGDESCATGAAESSVAVARTGEEVYNGACMACHSTGAAGAPKVGDAGAWAARMTKGMDALYASGVNGVAGTGMIARGGCSNCSDDEIYAAVDYMVDNSQ